MPAYNHTASQRGKIIEKRIQEVVDAVHALNGKVERQLFSALGKKLDDATLKKQLQDIQSFVKATDGEIRQWLFDTVPESYVQGLNEANKNLKTAKVKLDDVLKQEKFLLHRNAINILLKDSYLDFGNTMVGVVKQSERILTDVAKRQIRNNIIAGEMTGASVKEVAADIRSTLEQQGFKVVINKAGTKLELPTYAEMLARTNLIKSANEGVINRTREAGGDFVEWLAASDERTCDICESYDGKIFSISGKSSNFDEVPDCPAHPNCRCSLAPRPDITEEDVDE